MSGTLSKYQLQLEQVNASLATNPQSPQLLSLKQKLEQLLELQHTLEQTASETRTKQLKGHTTESPLQTGEACEAFCEPLKQWKSGRIVSMTAERDAYIVNFDTDRTTQRLAAVHVRRPRPVSKPAMKKKPSAVQKTRVKPRKPKAEPEGPSEWKKFADKMGKTNKL